MSYERTAGAVCGTTWLLHSGCCCLTAPRISLLVVVSFLSLTIFVLHTNAPHTTHTANDRSTAIATPSSDAEVGHRSATASAPTTVDRGRVGARRSKREVVEPTTGVPTRTTPRRPPASWTKMRLNKSTRRRRRLETKQRQMLERRKQQKLRRWHPNPLSITPCRTKSTWRPRKKNRASCWPP